MTPGFFVSGPAGPDTKERQLPTATIHWGGDSPSPSPSLRSECQAQTKERQLPTATAVAVAPFYPPAPPGDCGNRPIPSFSSFLSFPFLSSPLSSLFLHLFFHSFMGLATRGFVIF